MALHFDFTKVHNSATVCLTPEGEIRAVTDALIWLTIAVDLGEITLKNADLFIERLRMYEMVSRPMGVSAEHVRAHIGLSTNVSSLSDVAFGKKILRLMKERAKRSLQNEDDETQKARCAPAAEAA
jgi:hypothetical protein